MLIVVIILIMVIVLAVAQVEKSYPKRKSYEDEGGEAREYSDGKAAGLLGEPTESSASASPDSLPETLKSETQTSEKAEMGSSEPFIEIYRREEADHWICPYCGIEQSADAKYCDLCGTEK